MPDLSSLGPAGVVAGVLLYLLLETQRDLRAERAARIEDARKMLGLLNELQARASRQTLKLGDVARRLSSAPPGGP